MTTRSQDVVFTFSMETLADAQMREYCRPPDRALLALLGSSRVRRVVVVDPWRSRAAAVIRASQGRRVRPAALPGAEHVRPMRWRRHDPRQARALRGSYEAYDSLMRRSAPSGAVLVTFSPFVAAFSPATWASRVVFYARDDWSSFPPVRPWWPRIEEAYRRIAARGTAVCGVSEEVVRRIGSPDSLVLPNGIDHELWTSPRAAGGWDDLPRPAVVYAGTVDERLDVEAVLAVASDPAVGCVVVAGPVADSAHAAPLGCHPAVRLVGRLPQVDLVGLLRSADVCLLAHRRTPLTEAMSPLKLYEYLAAGKPVVATDLPPVRSVGEGVILVQEDYVGAVRQALQRGPLPEGERRALVERHSWRSRHSTWLDFVLGPA